MKDMPFVTKKAKFFVKWPKKEIYRKNRFIVLA